MDIGTLFTADNLVALLTLTALEIVLGIDNIIFIAILVGRLPEHQRAKGRTIGLLLALAMRVVMLLSIGWIMQLREVLFSVLGHGVTGKDLVLILGGVFLVAKATLEIHHKIDLAGDPEHLGPLDGPAKLPAGDELKARKPGKVGSFSAVLTQIVLLDVVFSLDSVITAVGMVDTQENKAGFVVIVLAVVIAIAAMIAFAGFVSRFVDKNPTIKMLALAFLVLIGVMLVAEGTGTHIPKGYIYSAMSFSLVVEGLNMWVRSRKKRARGGRS